MSPSFAGNSEQEVLRAMVEPGERANGVASVSSHTEFVDPPNVDSDAHSLV